MIESRGFGDFPVSQDELTGLADRAALQEHLDSLFGSYADSDFDDRLQFAILCIDLDGFKSFNEQHGRAEGDLVLKLVADRLQSCMRKNDVVYRIDGDEFAIVLLQVTANEVASIADRIIGYVSHPYQLADGKTADITVTVGAALAPRDGDTPESLLWCGDAALYIAKKAGRGVYRRYSERRSS
ncbi:GGDEF domain-containing protein [Phyllobacterium sp. 21LDTY02-6]|jgi:diguanylate cyclase (GGDEF)-like protein|uniref:GGDEF domain-containing protein n=1 Tax=unclassified Phyllobacterium TaxID=2638441 RepID=UPI00201FEB34|nr:MULTISPECIES: GGDEF domain-containing protein [unclassified Phyllobacterium]MCO4316378.1 GGDEF domain-containing protein [Phyllobacterium sp. 21LDTY02-6]MCX8280818.1 GGDEF domain-containing protein [Phyllobacterium sp. 0TCS1.6C]MCX8292605.1 GGDEF domain-containing protein [Phyllobacterium sp. 0TCS1.6A]